MKTLILLLCFTPTLAVAQIQMHTETLSDTSGLQQQLELKCQETGHGPGNFMINYPSVVCDTTVVGGDMIERTLDASYSVYKCPRCGSFYRYPQAGYVRETLLIIGRAQ